MYCVVWMTTEGDAIEYGEVTFDSERAARKWINERADGSMLFRLWLGRPSTGELLVESCWPVLMVA